MSALRTGSVVVGCLVVGATVGYWLPRIQPDVAITEEEPVVESPASDALADRMKLAQARIIELERENALLKVEQKLAARTGQALPGREQARSETDPDSMEIDGLMDGLESIAEMVGGEAEVTTMESLPENFRTMIKTANAKQRKSRIGKLLGEINRQTGLTTEQSLEVMQLLERSEEGRSGLVDRMFSGEALDAETVSRVAELSDAEAFERELAGILDEDQMAGYQDYQQKVKENLTEVVARRDLNQLQSTVMLDEEQKEQAMAAFAEIAGDTLTKEPGGYTAPFLDMGANERKKEALTDILTPEQMRAYEHKAQSGVMTMPGGGVTIQTIQMDVEP